MHPEEKTEQTPPTLQELLEHKKYQPVASAHEEARLNRQKNSTGKRPAPRTRGLLK